MTVTTNFKPPIGPKKPKPSAASKRPGMDEKHLSLIRQLPSCISGKGPCEAHHLRCAGGRGVGLKAEDRWAVPLTHEEHMELHRVGSKREFAWFASRGINCMALARALWNRRRLEAMLKVLEAHREEWHE